MNFNFTEVQCWDCGIIFGIHSTYVKNRKEDNKAFYCPNGHKNYFYEETEEEKLRKEIEVIKKRSRDAARRWEASANRSVIAYKGQITKLKKQLKAQK